MGANITAKAKNIMVGSNNTLKVMSTKEPCDITNDFKTDTYVRSGEENEDLKSNVESSEAIDDDSQDGDLGSWNSSDLDSEEDVDENETDVLMVGKNTLDLGIGNYIQRRHDLGENTRVNIRHQRRPIQGIQAGENMYIHITVNSYPSVEKAVIQAYQHNEDFSSKLQRWFSDFLVILAGVDHGSIIIELKPESPESLERMLNAIKDGSFDDVILDILREKSVFELIKGKEVTVDVQLETRPAATESIASSSPDIDIRLKGNDSDSTVLDSTVQGCHRRIPEKKENDQHAITSPEGRERRMERAHANRLPRMALWEQETEDRYKVIHALRNYADNLVYKRFHSRVIIPLYLLAIYFAVSFKASDVISDILTTNEFGSLTDDSGYSMTVVWFVLLGGVVFVITCYYTILGVLGERGSALVIFPVYFAVFVYALRDAFCCAVNVDIAVDTRIIIVVVGVVVNVVVGAVVGAVFSEVVGGAVVGDVVVGCAVVGTVVGGAVGGVVVVGAVVDGAVVGAVVVGAVVGAVVGGAVVGGAVGGVVLGVVVGEDIGAVVGAVGVVGAVAGVVGYSVEYAVVGGLVGSAIGVAIGFTIMATYTSLKVITGLLKKEVQKKIDNYYVTVNKLVELNRGETVCQFQVLDVDRKRLEEYTTAMMDVIASRDGHGPVNLDKMFSKSLENNKTLYELAQTIENISSTFGMSPSSDRGLGGTLRVKC